MPGPIVAPGSKWVRSQVGTPKYCMSGPESPLKFACAAATLPPPRALLPSAPVTAAPRQTRQSVLNDGYDFMIG